MLCMRALAFLIFLKKYLADGQPVPGSKSIEVVKYDPKYRPACRFDQPAQPNFTVNRADNIHTADHRTIR